MVESIAQAAASGVVFKKETKPTNGHTFGRWESNPGLPYHTSFIEDWKLEWACAVHQVRVSFFVLHRAE
jgi:hypothetical protein